MTKSYTPGFVKSSSIFFSKFAITIGRFKRNEIKVQIELKSEKKFLKVEQPLTTAAHSKLILFMNLFLFIQRILPRLSIKKVLQ